MVPLAFDEMEMSGSSGYEHYYRQNIADNAQGSTPKAKLKRLGLELKKLAEEGSLPVSAESAIYVKHDETRADVLKVRSPSPSPNPNPDPNPNPNPNQAGSCCSRAAPRTTTRRCRWRR